MGAENSKELMVGFQILKIQPNSPAEKAGLMSFLDWVVVANRIRLDTDNATFVELIKASEDKKMNLQVYNVHTQQTRDVDIIPSRGWGGNGLLGATIRFGMFDGCLDNIWHVVEVYPNTPASKAGLQSETDYIIGTLGGLFRSPKELEHAVTEHLNRILSLAVFSTVSNNVRIVKVELLPWGGEMRLGCDIGTGFLHAIPSNTEKVNIEENIEGNPTTTSLNYNSKSSHTHSHSPDSVPIHEHSSVSEHNHNHNPISVPIHEHSSVSEHIHKHSPDSVHTYENSSVSEPNHRYSPNSVPIHENSSVSEHNYSHSNSPVSVPIHDHSHDNLNSVPIHEEHSPVSENNHSHSNNPVSVPIHDHSHDSLNPGHGLNTIVSNSSYTNPAANKPLTRGFQQQSHENQYQSSSAGPLQSNLFSTSVDPNQYQQQQQYNNRFVPKPNNIPYSGNVYVPKSLK